MVDETYIHSLPLASLPLKTRKLLSRLLNSPKIIPSDGPDKLPRDWRGLACRVKISAATESFIQQCMDKTAKVLEIWQQDSTAPDTIGDLLAHLQYIDRYDVYDDVYNDLKEAASSGELTASRANQVVRYHYNGGSAEGDDDLLTTDDKPGYAKFYDAFVLFADEDRSFVEEMLRRMKDEGFDLCTVDDLQIGHTTQYAPVAQLIADRCRRIILVLSPEFLNSSGMKFYGNLAQAIAIESKERKILPIMYRMCQLPHHLSFYHKLFYSHSSPRADDRPMYDFWYKLKQSLDAARAFHQSRLMTDNPARAIRNLPPSISIEEYPSGPLIHQYLEDDGLFLPSDRCNSMNALDTLTINAKEVTDSHSLSNISQISGATERKKKKTNPLSRIFSKSMSKLRGKKVKKAIMVAD